MTVGQGRDADATAIPTTPRALFTRHPGRWGHMQDRHTMYDRSGFVGCIRVVVLQQQRLHGQPVCDSHVLPGSLHMTRPDENTLAETYQHSVLDEPAYDGRRQPEGGGHLRGTTDTQAPDA